MSNAKKASAANAEKEIALSKHDKVALDAAKTDTKNNGSHIVKQREALIAANEKESK